MQVEVMDKYVNKSEVVFDLSLLQWLQLKLTGKVHVLDLKLKGWKGEMPFYIFKCGTCKKFTLNYPQGYGQYLYCNNHKSVISKSKPAHIKIPEILEASA